VVTRLFAAALCGLILTAAPASAANLVTNGDFSAGATGFTSTYSTTVSGATANQGSYAATTNPALLCSSCFLPIGDHTTGTGNMLFVDGAGSNPDAFWSQTFAVNPNTTYSVSFWATSVNAAINGGARSVLGMTANSDWVISPTQLNYTTGNTATTWLKYSGTWSSGAASSVTLSMFDTNIIYLYNDFAVDDINFKPVDSPVGAVPEPASWALMILGFGAVGGALRRRKRTALALSAG
jgi:hypothetical protein